VEDLASAILHAMDSENTRGRVFTVTNSHIKARDYVKECVRKSEYQRVRVVYVPYLVARTGALIAAILKKGLGRGPALNRRRLLSVYRNAEAGPSLLTKKPVGSRQKTFCSASEKKRNRRRNLQSRPRLWPWRRKKTTRPAWAIPYNFELPPQSLLHGFCPANHVLLSAPRSYWRAPPGGAGKTPASLWLECAGTNSPDSRADPTFANRGGDRLPQHDCSVEKPIASGYR